MGRYWAAGRLPACAGSGLGVRQVEHRRSQARGHLRLPAVETFHFTGAPQTAVVPAGAHAAIVTLIGGRGGVPWVCHPTPDPALAGKPAEVTARFPVSPGERLTVRVGGHGGDGHHTAPGAGGWGERSGGRGGASSSGDGGGGGGASGVEAGGTMLAIAGGGGGGADLAFIAISMSRALVAVPARHQAVAYRAAAQELGSVVPQPTTGRARAQMAATAAGMARIDLLRQLLQRRLRAALRPRQPARCSGEPVDVPRERPDHGHSQIPAKHVDHSNQQSDRTNHQPAPRRVLIRVTRRHIAQQSVESQSHD
jgi:hypothetical protein